MILYFWQGLQQLTDAVHAFCADMGMRINATKTEVVVFDKHSAGHQWTAGHHALPQVLPFKYLGLIFSHDCSCDRMLEAMIRRGDHGVAKVYDKLNRLGLRQAGFAAVQDIHRVGSIVWLRSVGYQAHVLLWK